MARARTFDLAAELAKPSFTPSVRDAAALVDLIAGGVDPGAARAATATVKLGDAGRDAIAGRLGDATDVGARARLVSAIGLFARHGDAHARAVVLAQIADGQPRVRRAAIGVLGKLSGDDARDALIARWDAGDAPPDERRALAEALGRIGGEAAIARLAALGEVADEELARRRDRALLMAERSARRELASSIATDVPPPAPLVVRLGCRRGLGGLLAEELAAAGLAPRAHDDAGATLVLAAPWSALFAARLWSDAAIVLPSIDASRSSRSNDRVEDPTRLAEAITREIVAEPVRALMRAWTRGPIRWRLGFGHGHKRAIVWRVARDVTARAPELVNDPAATTWEVICAADAGTLELVPRRIDDPRFAWRTADVPAASHPTVAAALAWVAEARPTDRVWDPFCGSGAELIERARRGAYRSLEGSDLDDAALAAARANLASAEVTAALVQADVRDGAVVREPVDLVITNPPLGGRIRGDAAALLGEALPHLARRLAPGGRLVWITPAPKRTSPVAAQLGLVRVRALPVDLGGMRGQLERWDRSR